MLLARLNLFQFLAPINLFSVSFLFSFLSLLEFSACSFICNTSLPCSHSLHIIWLICVLSNFSLDVSFSKWSFFSLQTVSGPLVLLSSYSDFLPSLYHYSYNYLFNICIPWSTDSSIKEVTASVLWTTLYLYLVQSLAQYCSSLLGICWMNKWMNRRRRRRKKGKKVGVEEEKGGRRKEDEGRRMSQRKAHPRAQSYFG